VSATGGALRLVLQQREVVPLRKVVAPVGLSLEGEELEDALVQLEASREVADPHGDMVDDRRAHPA
jgi:hypothetical protein